MQIVLSTLLYINALIRTWLTSTVDSASNVVYRFACMFEALKFAVVLFSSISTLVVTVAQTRLNKRS